MHTRIDWGGEREDADKDKVLHGLESAWDFQWTVRGKGSNGSASRVRAENRR